MVPRRIAIKGLQRTSRARTVGASFKLSREILACFVCVRSRSRRSGISDQRLAELETLAGLKSLRHRLKGITFPVAYGLVDPNKIGKRKRSFESLEDGQQQQQQQQHQAEYQGSEDGAFEDLLTGMPTAEVVGRMRPPAEQLLRI